MKRVVCFALAVFLALPSAGAQDAAALQAFVDRAAADYLGPAFAAFADGADTLLSAATALCAAPGEPQLAAAREALLPAALAFARVMPLQIAPFVEDHRRERVLYWPDPRGVALRQVQELLAVEDETATDLARLRDKSVAVQGLAAIEFLLFGTGSEGLVTGDDYRCRFAATAAASMAAIAANLAAMVAPEGPFTRSLRESGPDNVLYRSEAEAVSDLVLSAATAVESAHRGLATVLGATQAEAMPRTAPLWRSGLGITFIAALATGVADGLLASGLREAVPAHADLVDEIEAALARLRRALPPPGTAVADAVVDPVLRDALLAALAILDELKVLLGEALPAALGVNLGFNALDGD
ncbi:MAG: hypothetical protein KIS96_08115 [Bauldia sp.]|nr:hypothetical protein [Bauldia sp.]